MSLITRMRRQKAVWWERSTEPDGFGRYSYAAPVEIDCRWDDSGREFRNTKGQTVMSNAVVYVDRVLKIGDMLRRGDMDSDEPLDPTDVATAYEISGFDRNPNIRNTEELLTAFL